MVKLVAQLFDCFFLLFLLSVYWGLLFSNGCFSTRFATVLKGQLGIKSVKMIANGAQARVLTLSDSGKLKGPV